MIQMDLFTKQIHRLKKFFYLMWTIFNNLYWIRYNIASVLCPGFLAVDMWDRSSLTRDQTCILCLRRWSFNPWTARKSQTHRLWKQTYSYQRDAAGLHGTQRCPLVRVLMSFCIDLPVVAASVLLLLLFLTNCPIRWGWGKRTADWPVFWSVTC